MSDYGIDPILAMLLSQPTMDSAAAGTTASTKNVAKNYMTQQAKATNNFQDLASVLTDPKIAALFGTLDPMTLIDQQPVIPEFQWDDNAHLTKSLGYTSSGNPVVKEVAVGLLGGQLDPISAQQRLIQAVNNGELPDFKDENGQPDPSRVVPMVQIIQEEVAKNETAKAEAKAKYDSDVAAAQSKPKDDVYTKAGLPSPLEQYTADNLPGFDQGPRGEANMAAGDSVDAYQAAIAKSQGIQDGINGADRTVAGNDRWRQAMYEGFLANEKGHLSDSPQDARGDQLSGSYGTPTTDVYDDRGKGATHTITSDQWNEIQQDPRQMAKGMLVKDPKAMADWKQQHSASPFDIFAALASKSKKSLQGQQKGASEAQESAFRGYRDASAKANDENARASGAAAGARAAGRSPTSDAIQQRLAMMRQLGLV